MRIAEISSQDQTPTTSPSLSLLISQLESAISQLPHHPSPPHPSLAAPIRTLITQLTPLAPFPNPIKLQLWNLSFRLWNACVDLSNTTAHHDKHNASLRHIAADILSLTGSPPGVPSPEFKTASFYYRTGVVYHELKVFDLACDCFEKASDVLNKMFDSTRDCFEEASDILNKVEVNGIKDKGERKLVFDLSVARARTAWEVSERNLAVNILNRAKSLLFGSAEHYRALASQYLAFGKSELSKGEDCNTREALKLMNDALELCEKGFSTARTREDSVQLRDLKSKSLRFISAVQLQNGEFESVLKCVKVLREGDTKDSHPSLPVLAMKAWLGLGNYPEAEKELKGMVVNNRVPEGVWVSAVEAYFKASGTAGVETAKGVFLGLLGRCHVSAGAAVRVVHRVIGDSGAGGEGSKIRAKVVLELVSDERVVEILGADAAGKERTAMHAVLWNCAADHFRSKDYDTSALMFEKSMLYVPHEIENRILRAKCFRVLCLCHLGLSQLDRALEYINEAEKLEPNTASAFLKLKIYLQQKDHDRAVSQLQTMASCLDFTSDFLSLAANEAIACRALSVAVASLASLLEFYTLGKSMPTSEVLVLRTLVTILTQEPGTNAEVLRYLSHALARASKLGPDCFFGKGEVGRQERNWFAVTSWNFGVKIGKDKNYELCVGFLKLASEFNNFQLDGQAEENSVMVCKSLILTVSAMTALEEQQKAALSEAEVKQALELIDRAGKILNSSSLGGKLNDDQTATVEPDFFFMYTLNAYEMYGRLNDGVSRQLHLIKSFAGSAACNPKYLLQIGLHASEGPRSNHEVATFALSECLSSLLSSPSVDYGNVAFIIRRLITLTSIHKGDTDDNALYSMYKQAYRIMVGLKEGEYPTEEGKWLATTAWNRAALPVRLGQIDMAKKWMNVGLELSRHIVGMETYKACMEDFVSGFQKKFPPQNEENLPQLVS